MICLRSAKVIGSSPTNNLANYILNKRTPFHRSDEAFLLDRIYYANY